MAQGSKSSLQAAFLQEMEKARTAPNYEAPPVFASPPKEKPKTSQSQLVHANGSVDKYRMKYVRLKKLIKRMIFLNAALCDEVTKAEEQVAKVRDQRRFLLRRLQEHQALPELVSISTSPTSHSTSAATTSSSSSTTTKPTAVLTPGGTEIKIEGEKPKSRKKINPAKKKEKKESVPVLGSDPAKPKPKKSKSSGGKRYVQPIPLDNTGRPIFPIELGPLTIHSLGEITSDRPGYHSVENIYPIGFCSTRTYASLRNPTQKCLYTCKILDTGTAPKFEISPEDAPDKVISSDTPDDCHKQLLAIIFSSRGIDLASVPEPKGAEFFGICHPTVQNLIQCCPGARKCSSYKWVKFEVCRVEMSEAFHDDTEVVNFDALQRSALIQQSMDYQEQGAGQGSNVLESSSSLRSLLTSGPLIASPHT